MFTIDQIKTAHSKVKSGADFPAYVQDIIKLGVTRYSTYVSDGHTQYCGRDNYQIQTEARYKPLPISDKSDAQYFQQQLKTHQQGGTDYPTFCRDCANSGVEKWEVDMHDMTCSYFDKAGNKMLVEKIPGV